MKTQAVQVYLEFSKGPETRRYPVFRLNWVLIVDMAAQPHDIKILEAERTPELCSRILIPSIDLLIPKIRIYKPKHPIKPHSERLKKKLRT